MCRFALFAKMGIFVRVLVYNNIKNGICQQPKEKIFCEMAIWVLTRAQIGAIIYKQSEANHGRNAGMAELADARDLKSREIFSRTGSTPASGTIYRGVEQSGSSSGS